MSWNSFQHLCQSVKYRSDISRFRKAIENNGTFKAKAAEVRKYVKEMFNTARTNHLPVHDIDLRRWAIKKANALDMPFKACSSWIFLFKQKARIGSRKVTKVITSNMNYHWDTISNTAEEFRLKAQNIIKNYPAKNIWNTDQMGFNKEMHST